jgi:hypothetical protein
MLENGDMHLVHGGKYFTHFNEAPQPLDRKVAHTDAPAISYAKRDALSMRMASSRSYLVARDRKRTWSVQHL